MQEQTSSWRKRLARIRRGDDGASAIELAVLAPVLLLLILMTIQYAFYFQARQVALSSAQEGARYARQEEAMNPGSWQKDAEDQATSYFNSLSSQVLSDFRAGASYVPADNNVQVTVSGKIVSLLGFPLPAIHESAEGPVECFRADGGQQCATG